MNYLFEEYILVPLSTENKHKPSSPRTIPEETQHDYLVVEETQMNYMNIEPSQDYMNIPTASKENNNNHQESMENLPEYMNFQPLQLSSKTVLPPKK